MSLILLFVPSMIPLESGEMIVSNNAFSPVIKVLKSLHNHETDTV
ncbi:hypothetical protein [Bacillus xiapuensis]|nr:hypothetical protein [Bacillus xiapuensis]